jgi:chaperonin cofactor prefoldin
MGDANVRPFPELAATGIRATIDAVLRMRSTLERAIADLGRAREKKVLERIDLFLSRSTITPADAQKAQQELVAVRKIFEDQEAALRFWESEVNNRLGRLAVDNWTELVEALDARIASLRQQEEKEQGDVDELKSVISEFEALRAELQLKRYPTGSSSGRAAKASQASPRKRGAAV